MFHDKAKRAQQGNLLDVFLLHDISLLFLLHIFSHLQKKNIFVVGEERIRVIFRQIYQRDPKEWELKSAKLFIDEFIPAAAAWQMLGQALLVSNEMMFVD